MKMLAEFLLLVKVSQHALAVLVEVNEGAESVLLPCQYSGVTPEDPTVMWTRSDLDPKSVHLLREGGDDLRGQNQRYSRRTSMRSDALDSGDFSLTLRNPQLTDSSSYTCSISDGRRERRLRDIQLQVKDQQVEVKVEEGSESVILPCKTTPDLPEDTRVEWTHSDQEPMYIIQMKMNEDLLRTGDLSLTLKQPTQRDTGGYICTIYRDKDILRQKVVLQVKEPFPSWDPALLVLLVLLVFLVVSGGLLFYFRQYFMPAPKVEVYSGMESVQLLCKAAVHLLKVAKVEWKDSNNRKVHVYQNGFDQLEEQDQVYRGRTKMNEDLLRTGDLSLTLKQPIDGDTNTYTCTIYNSDKIMLMKKEVELKVRVPQKEVDSGMESVKLPFRTTGPLPEDVKVEWMGRDNRKVHVYQNSFDQPGEQDQVYGDRAKMNEDLLRTGDLSLTLKHPTDKDTRIYTCTVYNREGNILIRTQVELKVKVPQMEADSRQESVQLPCKTKVCLPEDAKVEWIDTYNRKVHVYQSGSDKPKEQDQAYGGRTEMNKDRLKTGDFSLTLKHLTDWDTNTYTCTVYSSEGNILMRKQVQLKVRVCQVEVEEGAKSVQLPFKTTKNLPEDVRVVWKITCDEELCIYPKSSDSKKQHQHYTDENPLKNGDLSLTLKMPLQKGDRTYRCEVRRGNPPKVKIIIWKSVRLRVKGRAQVQDQTGIIGKEEAPLI